MWGKGFKSHFTYNNVVVGNIVPTTYENHDFCNEIIKACRCEVAK